jgi:hypothetical protein
MGLTLGTTITCSGSDKVSALTTDTSGKLKVVCSSDTSSAFSSSNISTTQCGSNEFVAGLKAATTTSVGVNCSTRTLPSFSTTSASFKTSTNGTSYTGSMAYDGTSFTVIIPSGMMGSTVSLDSANDSCSGTDKVSALTLTSGVFRVVCTTDDVTPISSVAVTPLNVGATPTATYTTSNKRLTLGIPAGATGAKGDTGATGANGADGISPTISVNSTINSGTAAVSVAKTANDYKFTFTLPTIPTGYTAMTACMNKSTGALYIKTTCSNSSETKYTILLDTSP